MSKHLNVRVWTEDTVIPTYLPAVPDLNPMFLERRVYQGSSGKVYPLPFTERIAETKTDRRWKAVWLENKYLRVMILPEIGGRIHVAQDKTNGYDFIYRQTVIKPALVGLAGPWISGGIEFNWPQHHRPTTFLPASMEIEEHADGSKTVWLGDHEPMGRMKGMHGVCLHPDQALIEVKVRLYNRTPHSQTFLWWANMGVRTHEAYQSFFPPDIQYVADHAKRAVSEFPLCRGTYYGVDYGERERNGVAKEQCPKNFLPPHCGGKTQLKYPPNDLSWYANIPTPCSYMCLGTTGDFFGGYDHAQQAGIIHLADHHIAPGKKQWTWGNHDFGYAWDRNLTDDGGPYVELMAGVFTDNQPDFSFLQPGETKTWSQYFAPLQKIGPPQHANLQAAVHLTVNEQQIRLGASVSKEFPGANIRLECKSWQREWTVDLQPGKPFVTTLPVPDKSWQLTDATLRVIANDGKEIIAYTPQKLIKAEAPAPATEPPPLRKIRSADELYLTGLHLHQYRHPSRCPTLYWREAIRRDPLDSRCNNAMGLWHFRRGEFVVAEKYFRTAIQSLTRHNPNPSDGEAHYNLGFCLLQQLAAAPNAAPQNEARLAEAYAAFYKATWNHAWQSAGYHALAEMDCRNHDWNTALAHLNHSLRINAENLRARDLKALVLRKLERGAEAEALLRETLAFDPLDWWARSLLSGKFEGDNQVRLDHALDFIRAGFYKEAIALLYPAQAWVAPQNADASELPTLDWGTAPLIHYYLGWLHERLGDVATALACYREAAKQSPDYCFPARLEEIGILAAARRANPADARAPYYLGNLFYDRGRYAEALAAWEQSAKLDSGFPTVWRNLGIAYLNIARQPARARAAYQRAIRANPADARILYEQDQLWKRLGEPPKKRLSELKKNLDLVAQRDDLTIELCALYNHTGQPGKALALIANRHFQPWEGGEGLVLAQHVRTHLTLGRRALAGQDFPGARSHFETALASPPNLGEARHLLANQSDVHYWLGVACDALGDKTAAKNHWLAAATFRGDFQEMKVRKFSEMTYFSALARGCLGQKARKRTLLKRLLAYAQKLQQTEARSDYFATSLPAMLLFDEDIQVRQETTALLLQAQAQLGLGNKVQGRGLLARVLKRDPNHSLAIDLQASA